MTSLQPLSSLREFPPMRRLLKSRYERRFRTALGVGALSGSFPSFGDAAIGAPANVPRGYDHAASAGLYQDRMEAIRLKDYPALFWLTRALPEARTLFDVGGHVGLMFYAYRRYLDYPLALRWTVCDVPAVVREGEALARARGESQLSFTTRLDDAPSADVVLATGSLQYIERTLDAVIAQTTLRPRHILVNETPTHPDREFITLQNIGVAFCPYRIAARNGLPTALGALGYELLDTWEDLSRRTAIPYYTAPGSIAYTGYYFRLR